MGCAKGGGRFNGVLMVGVGESGIRGFGNFRFEKTAFSEKMSMYLR